MLTSMKLYLSLMLIKMKVVVQLEMEFMNQSVTCWSCDESSPPSVLLHTHYARILCSLIAAEDRTKVTSR